MPLDTNEIRRRVKQLSEHDPKRVLFGANGHQYRFRPPLPQFELEVVEEQYSINLPVDYRQFLLELGNGGAGPDYGVLGLDQLVELNPIEGVDLGKPFPYRHAWNASSEWRSELDAAEAAEDEERAEKLVEDYWRNAVRHGSISIAEHGCGLWHLLVVNGFEFGNVWFSRIADYGGYCPIETKVDRDLDPLGRWWRPVDGDALSRRLTFAEWYFGWLDFAESVLRTANTKVFKNGGTRGGKKHD